MIETAPESTYGALTGLLRRLAVGDSLHVDSRRLNGVRVISPRIGIRVETRKLEDRPGYHRVTRIA